LSFREEIQSRAPRRWSHSGGMDHAVVRVRRAGPDDGLAIGEVHAESWLGAYVDILDPEFVARAAEGRRVGWPSRIRQLLTAPNTLLVAEVDGRICAFAHAGPANSDASIGEVYGFYSRPEVWGTGVAGLLMEAVCSELVPAWQEAVLWTMRDARRARRFYEKAGWYLTGEEKLEPLSDWTTGTTATPPAVEYRRWLTR